ncbi:MAG TPA: glycosyltransferase family 9 protein [Solirubrobacteraceae bacterium]|nr:glycosyltransferase family 9 protein [Solirubrobacteraceae bacterium]
MTHVLAVRLDNDGDVLLAGPAIRALAHGADRVTLLCGPRGRQAARLLPGVDRIVVWRAPWIDPDPETLDRAQVEALVDRLAALRLGAAVVFGSFHQSPLPTALVLRMAGVPFIAATCVDYPGSLLDLRHSIGDDVHEVERALDLAAAAGFPLPPDDDGALAIRRAAATWSAAGFVVVHPGASVPARAWAPERNAELVRALVAGGRRVVVTGTPGERRLTSFVAGPPCAEVTDLGGRTSLAELAEVLAAADCIVVGNTAPAHLAAAVGTPVVSLFAPTVPAVRWRPWRVPHELLYADVSCAGCRARVCHVEGHPCLGSVAAEDVVRAVDRLAPVALEAVA